MCKARLFYRRVSLPGLLNICAVLYLPRITQALCCIFPRPCPKPTSRSIAKPKQHGKTEAKLTATRQSRSKRSRSTRQTEPKQTEANLHSTGSPCRDFAKTKALLLASRTSAASEGFSSLMLLVLVNPSASNHRAWTRSVHLS